MSHATYSSPADIPGFLLWSLSKLWEQNRRASLATLGISHTQFVLLANVVWLSNRHHIVTQQVLSSWTRIDKVTVSAVISRLETKGLLKRQVHPPDRRAYELEVTAEGRRIALEGVREVERTNAAFFAPLENELPDLVRLLQVLLRGHGEMSEE
jgi:DNA-binding MarR family transcriptional regulator